MSARGWLVLLTSAVCGVACDSLDAGVVLVSQDVDGVLNIIGSGDDDNISVNAGTRSVTLLALGSSRFPSSGRRGSRRLSFDNVTGVVFQGLGGNDTFTANLPVDYLEYEGGEGDDILAANVGPAAGVSIDCGSGNDTVVLTADGAASVSVELGDGDDTFTLSTSAIGAFSLTDGGGNDQILLNGVTGIPEVGIVFSIQCGDGDDQVALNNCHLTSVDPMVPALFHGGDNSEEGVDQIAQAGSTFTPTPLVVEFEVVIDIPLPPPPEPLRLRRR
jgi:hypothetical protein